MYCPKCGMYVLKSETICPNCKLDLTQSHLDELSEQESSKTTDNADVLVKTSAGFTESISLNSQRHKNDDQTKTIADTMWYIMTDKEDGPYSEHDLIQSIKAGWIDENTKIRPETLKIWLPVSKTKLQEHIPRYANTRNETETEQNPKSEDCEPSRWYVLNRERSYGPFSEPTMIKSISSGNLPGNTLIRQEGSETWITIAQSPLSKHIPSAEFAENRSSTYRFEHNPKQIHSYAQTEQKYADNNIPPSKISDIWLWAISTVPLLSLIFNIFALANGIDNYIIYWAVPALLYFLFMVLDYNKVINSGIPNSSWKALIVMGLLFIPLYMFVRAAHTNKNYAPGITLCVLLFLSLFFTVSRMPIMILFKII